MAATTYPIYTLPSEELFAAATLTLTAGTADATYVLANLTGGVITNPAKFLSLNATIALDLGSAQAVQIVGLIHTNLDATLNVRIQASSDNFVTTAQDQPLVIQTHDNDGFVPGSYADLTSITNTYRYWRLVVPTNSVGPILGGLFGYAVKHTVQHFAPGTTRARTRFAQTQTTGYGIDLTYDRGTRQRDKSGQIVVADRTSTQQWFDATKGMSKQFLFVPDPDLENDAWMARWTNPALTWTRKASQYWSAPATFREVNRGLAWIST